MDLVKALEDSNESLIKEHVVKFVSLPQEQVQFEIFCLFSFLIVLKGRIYGFYFASF